MLEIVLDSPNFYIQMAIYTLHCSHAFPCHSVVLYLISPHKLFTFTRETVQGIAFGTLVSTNLVLCFVAQQHEISRMRLF